MKEKLKMGVMLFLCAILLITGVPGQYQATEKAEKIKNREYKITLNNENEVFFGSEKKVDLEVGSRVCLVYTVEESTVSKPTDLIGFITTTDPTSPYPYTAVNSALKTTGGDKTDLLTEGYTYFFSFEKTAEGLEYNAYKTNGTKAEQMFFYGGLGDTGANWTQCGLWFRNFDGAGISAVLTNVRCYDEEGNDLGVCCNKGGAIVEFFGEISDYSKVVGAYYCEENGQILVVDSGMEVYEIDENGDMQDAGECKIYNQNNMIVFTEAGKEVYEYVSMYIEDADGNKYRYLTNSKVTFVTSEETFVVEPTAETGFRVQKPENPTKEGHTFKGWYLGDGTEFDFSKVVAESITLYAKWQDGDGHEYIDMDTPAGGQMDTFDGGWIVAVLVSLIIVGLSVMGCLIMIRKKAGMK